MRFHEIIQLDETIEIGDHFDLELDDLVIETIVVDITEDGVVIAADDTALSYIVTEDLDEGDRPPLAGFNKKPRRVGPGTSKDDYDYTTFVPRGKEAGEKWAIQQTVDKQKLKKVKPKSVDTGFYKNYLNQRPPREEGVEEAKYQGREVPLGKPMAGDVKKKKVYVKKPDGKVVKVNFGDKKMRIKKSNPKRRKSFRARHNCKNPGPRHKARYWSCRAW